MRRISRSANHASGLPAAAVGIGLFLCVLLISLHLLAIHQGPEWTSPLLIGDHLFDLLLALAILWYSLVLGRALGRPLLGLSDEPLSENLAALGLGLGILSLALLGLGLAHLFYGHIILGGALVLAFWLRRESGALARQAIREIAGWRARGMPTAPTHGQRLVLLLLILGLILISPRAALPPSYNASVVDLDTVSYHLAAVKVYIEAHGIVPRPDLPLANAPSGGDLLNVLGLYAGTDTVGRTLNLLFTLLLGVATYALGRRHFGQAGAWLGALLFSATTWLAPLAPTIVPDFGAAFLLVIGCSDLLSWASLLPGRFSPDPLLSASGVPRAARWSTDRRRDLTLIRAGIFLGLAVSFKLTNLPALPAAVLVAGLAPLLGDHHALPERLGRGARSAALLVACMLIPLAPWLLKNLVFFGAPLYPIAVGVNTAPTPSSSALVVTGAGPLSHLTHLWWIISTLGETYWHYVSPLSPLLLLAPFVLRRRSGGIVILLLLASGMFSLLFVPLFLPPRYWLGPIAVSDAVLAAVIGELPRLLKGRSIRTLFGVVLILDTIVWLAAIPLGQVTLPGMVAMGAAEAAIMIILVILRWRQRRIQLLELPIVALLCVGTLIGIFVTVRETSEHRFLAVADGALSRQAFLTQNNWYFPAYQWANRNLPGNATVVLVNLVAGYHLDRQYLDDWYDARYSALESGPASRRAELATWCRASIRYTIFDRNAYFYAPHAYRWTGTPGLAPRVLFSANGVDVLAISPCTVAAEGPDR